MSYDSAFLKAKKAIEKLYDHTCTITEYAKTKDPDTHITKQEEVILYEDIPCRISYKKVESTGSENEAPTAEQMICLFVSPDVLIKAGCKIAITHHNVTSIYKSSGEPAVYRTHNEYIMEKYEKWA